MAKLLTLQTFTSVSDIAKQHKVILRKPYDWRLIQEPCVGSIHGIPSMHGVAIATNGIEVAILQESSLVFGHIDNFVPDEQETELRIRVAAPKVAKRNQTPDISEFI